MGSEGSVDFPQVTVHFAQTLDGRIATRSGQSQWISGSASLRLAHELRAAHQAVLIGVGTVLADNPRLTVRLVPGRSPLRVIADSTLRLPLAASVLADGDSLTLIATTTRAPLERVAAVRRQGAEVLIVNKGADGRVDLADLLRRLHACGVGSLLIEGGQGIVTSALRQRLVDRLIVCIAPKIIGAGIPGVGDLGIEQLGAALCFAQCSFRPLGEDVIFDGRLERARTWER